MYPVWEKILNDNKITNFDSWLTYWKIINTNGMKNPHPFMNYEDFFFGKKVIMLNPKQVKPFLEKQIQFFYKVDLKIVNKTTNIKNIQLTQEQKERIKQIYYKNVNYIKENNWNV